MVIKHFISDKQYKNYIKSLICESLQPTIALVESRGVPTYKWKNEIDDIIDYICLYIKENYTKTKQTYYSFNLPEKYCDTISFIKNIEIHIDAFLDEDEMVSGGKITIPTDKVYFDFDTNNFIYGSIDIACSYDRSGNVFTAGLTNNLYHEITHAFDGWMKFVKGKTTHRLFGYITNNLSSDISDVIISMCAYRLLNHTEFSALCSSLYGELKGKNSSRENFAVDLSRSQSYKIYKTIKERYSDSIDSLSEENIEAIIQSYNDSTPFKYSSTEDFKTKFKLYIEQILKKLSIQFGKVASLWYDEKENLNNLE